jgi:Tol biopolymer transport system component
VNPTPDRLREALSDRYEIERELGAGGMATVYLANDLRHHRRVAIKVLRPELAAVIGADRFLAEIRTTANLQHPHILPLFESGHTDSFLFYVMPFVEGESLRDRLQREKQLPVGEAVRIAKEVASALDYAHRHGVIHRDIKPENILIHDGQALVADFGIALAASKAGGGRMTETGMSLGTPHYMSPEQAMGEREITARSDVYALGAVTYEMLSGEPPFTGPTAQAIVAKVMTEEPRALHLSRKTIPEEVEDAVRRALEKLPADRFESAAAFATALTQTGVATQARTSSSRAATTRGAVKPWRDWRILVAGGALLLIGAAGGWASRRAPETGRPVGRFRIPVEEGISPVPANVLAISEDGSAIVYAGRTGTGERQLYIRRIDALAANPIPGTRGATFPVLSPDGRQVGYVGAGGFFRTSVDGGSPTLVAGIESQAAAVVHWLEDDTFVSTDARGRIVRVGLDGKVSVVAAADSSRNEVALFPGSLLPGGRTILAVASVDAGTNGTALAIDLKSGNRKVILDGIVNRMWYSDGCLLWALPGGALLGARFDIDKLEVTGPVVTIADGVRLQVGGWAQVVVSSNGSLAYIPELPFNLAVVSRSGSREILETGRRFHSPRYSPNGRYIAMDFIESGNRDVWTLDLRNRTFARVSFENDGHDPVWMPDNNSLLYVSRTGIYRRRADGGTPAESVYVTGRFTSALAVTPDGKMAVTAPTGTNGGFDLGLLMLDGTRQQRPLLETPFNEQGASLSPDGRWMAYTSSETGSDEVYVRPFPGGGAKVVVSRGGGSEPTWNRTARELFYIGQKEGAPYLVAATFSAGSEFSVDSRTFLFDVSEFEPAQPHANYDVSPDGRGFVMVHQGTIPELVYVLNWAEEVRKGSAAKR